MYSCDQDHHAAARATHNNSTSYLHPCAAAGRSLHLSARQDPAAASAGSAASSQPPRRAKKKHAARPPSRRSSTTVVATDVDNFRAMVQELTGFPPAAIFRPLPRRVHAVSNPFAVAAAQGRGGDGRVRGPEATNAAGSLFAGAPPVQPVMAQSPQCAPPGVFDGLSDIGSPVFDSWSDLSIE